jgi:hypothetical protein
VAGRLRKLRQRFGIAAPKVAVRTQVPWYLRWLVIAVLFAFAAAFAAWIYDAGRRFAGFDRSEVAQELENARGELARLRSELDKLRAVANAADSKMSIERTAQQKLAQQIRSLGQDNARLREELALFESMLSSSDAGSAAPLSILRFKVEPDVLPGEYRYRVLLLASGPRRGKEFQGKLELVVGLTENARGAMITVPGQGEPEAPFRLAFKHFQRVDGNFRVSPKAKVGSVQVRVYEAGTAAPKVTQSVTLE